MEACPCMLQGHFEQIIRPAIVIKSFVHNLPVFPLGYYNLLHMYRMAAGQDEIKFALIEGHIVTYRRGRYVETLPLLDTASESLLSLDIGRLANGWRIGVFLHLHVLVIKFGHRLKDLVLTKILK